MTRALCGLFLAVLLMNPLASEALSLGADSIFTPSVGGCAGYLCGDVPAAFLITNNSAPGGNITQVVIDMTTASSSLAKFGGASGLLPNMGFTPLTGVSDTGFSTYTVSDKIITLNFTGFDPGDVLGFSFAVDIDDNSRTVTAGDFAGSTFQVVFGGLATLTGAFEPILQGALAEAKVGGVTRVPEPSSFLLVGLSLLGLALVGWKRLPVSSAQQPSLR